MEARRQTELAAAAAAGLCCTNAAAACAAVPYSYPKEEMRRGTMKPTSARPRGSWEKEHGSDHESRRLKRYGSPATSGAHSSSGSRIWCTGQIISRRGESRRTKKGNLLSRRNSLFSLAVSLRSIETSAVQGRSARRRCTTPRACARG